MCFSLHNYFLCFLILSIRQEIGSLEEVVMFQNGINADGISALASAFSHNKGLRVRVTSSFPVCLYWTYSDCCVLSAAVCVPKDVCCSCLVSRFLILTIIRLQRQVVKPWLRYVLLTVWCPMTTCDVVHRFMLTSTEVGWPFLMFFISYFFSFFLFVFSFYLQVLPSLENLCTVNFDDCLVRSEGFVAIADAFKNGCQKLKVGHHLNFFWDFVGLEAVPNHLADESQTR